MVSVKSNMVARFGRILEFYNYRRTINGRHTEEAPEEIVWHDTRVGCLDGMVM
jgi:hypothetical protein